jgi:hypothetical protein
VQSGPQGATRIPTLHPQLQGRPYVIALILSYTTSDAHSIKRQTTQPSPQKDCRHNARVHTFCEWRQPTRCTVQATTVAPRRLGLALRPYYCIWLPPRGAGQLSSGTTVPQGGNCPSKSATAKGSTVLQSSLTSTGALPAVTSAFWHLLQSGRS